MFAVILAAYQQQQQRTMAVWNLIMDGYDDNTELNACEAVVCGLLRLSADGLLCVGSV